MQLNIDKDKYKVSKKQIGVDEYQFNVVPKIRTCKLCKKGFDSYGKEFLTWFDDDGFLNSGYFCKKDFILVSKAIKMIEENR